MDYRLNKGDITLPDDWADETIYIFKAPEEEGYNIVINQSPIPHGIDSDVFLNEQYLLLREHLTSYHETKKERPNDEEPLQIVEYDWSSPEGKAYQINMMLVVDGVLLSFTATSTRKFVAEQKEIILSIFKSYKKLPPE